MRAAIVGVLLLAGCVSREQKCNRAKVAAHDAWAAVVGLDRKDDEAPKKNGAGTVLFIPYGAAGFRSGETLFGDAARASDAALRGAVAARDAAVAVEKPSPERLARIGGQPLDDAINTARAASTAAWAACADVAP